MKKIKENINTNLKSIYKNAFDKNGNFKNFKQQLKDFYNHQTYKGEKLLVQLNNSGLEYANITNVPLEITEHAIKSHNIPINIIENLPQELKDSVLALDSISRPELNARIIILNKTNIDGSPYIVAIHQKRNSNNYCINKVSSIYEKNNIQNFINQTILKGGKIYKNEKTNSWLLFNKLQLLKENNQLLVEQLNK